MSFEQHSSFAGQPPTPTRTPTSEEFDNAFDTPRVDSSFYDPRLTWNPAEPTASPSLLKTPRPLAPSTPTTTRVGNSFETSSKSRELNIHAAHLLRTPNFALLSPQAPSPELPSEQQTTDSMESAIRTPPPTNTGNGKRKEKQNGSAKTHNRSESKNRQLLPKPTEAGSSAIATESPALQFTPLPFGTPDLFNQNLEIPSTAPTYPQQRLFWDNNNPNEMELDFSSENPFATPRPSGLEPYISQTETNPSMHQGTFLDFDQMLANPEYNTSMNPAAMGSQMASLGQSVDPNLLFSNSMASVSAITAPTNGMLDDDSMQPYAYQLQEARRERAYAGINKAKRRRKPSVDSPAVAAALETLRDSSARPNIRRSVTDSYVARSGRSSSSSSRAGTSHGGRSSPIKQFRAETKRQHRKSVGLVIGSDGRARLEPVIHQDKGLSSSHTRDMDVDSTAYSSGSDSTESEDDDDAEQDAMVTSFSSDIGSAGGRPKIGRFNSSGPHSKNSSFSSLYSSTSEPTKVRKPSSKRASRHILDPVKEGGSFEDDRGQAGDSAQAALMQSMKASQRGRFSPQKQGGGLEPFVSSPSTIPDTGFNTPTSATSGRKSFR